MQFQGSRHCFLVLLFWLLQSQGIGTANVPKAKEKENNIENGDRQSGLGHHTTPSEITLGTKSGKIKGMVTFENGKVLTKFLGIPYALPPTGLLRFKTPQKHPGWILKILDATYERPHCPQGKLDWPGWMEAESYKQVAMKRDFDEDCLYMNVYVPRNLSEVEHINILSVPVIVYIHGGPFPGDGAWLLAQYGDVIVVTVQYRLGVLGFLSTGDWTAAGNFGLLDQKLAMHWVWDNIRELGGNSERITVLGEGSGAISIGYHIISPLSRGLFTRAISQSGTMLTRCCLQHNPRALVTSLSRKLGCSVGNITNGLVCLRTVGLDRLLSAASEVLELHKDSGWFPVIDGNFVPGEPLDLLRQGKYNDVDCIIGVNSHEGWLVHRETSLDLLSGVSLVELEQFIHATTLKYFDMSEQRLTALLLEYAYCKNDRQARTKALVEFYGDIKYTAPADMTARILSRGNRNIYFYYFSHRPSYTDKASGGTPSYVEATVGDEFDFVFGHAASTIKDATEQERTLGRAMMTAWSNFAKTGDPNPINQMGTNWKPYEEGNRYYIEFNTSLNSKSLKSFLRPGKMSFWNDYFPTLSSEKTCSAQEDLCYRRTASVRATQTKTTATMWALIGVCLFLVFLVIILFAKLCAPKECTKCSWKKREKSRSNGEERKLRPLPYCDET